MKILITGSHGLVGSCLTPFLGAQGHHVVRLVRSEPYEGELYWDPRQRVAAPELLEGFDAVVHLAGENIASGRWTSARKSEIRASRVAGTQFLCEVLAGLTKPPEVLVSASAIGFYGNRWGEELTEDSAPGLGFLSELCQEWEAATAPARKAGIRVANTRIGIVLSPNGGALRKMLPIFQMGAGGRLGSGEQFMSWIALEELAEIIEFILSHKELSGPINAVAPNPVTNREFTAALAAVLHRPAIFPVPKLAAHLLMGEMADELLFSSALVKPKKLLASGYPFRYPELKPMLRKALTTASGGVIGRAVS